MFGSLNVGIWDLFVIWCLEFDILQCSITPKHTSKYGGRKLATKNGKYSVTQETFDSLSSYWLDPENPLTWDCLFVLPSWMKVWWSVFDNGSTPYLSAVRDKNKIIGEGVTPELIELRRLEVLEAMAANESAVFMPVEAMTSTGAQVRMFAE